jgi:alpha-glucosidase
VKLVVENAAEFTQVLLNGVNLAQYSSQTAWEAAASGWYYAADNLIIAKSGKVPVGQQKVFEFKSAF